MKDELRVPRAVARARAEREAGGGPLAQASEAVRALFHEYGVKYGAVPFGLMCSAFVVGMKTASQAPEYTAALVKILNDAGIDRGFTDEAIQEWADDFPLTDA